MTSPLDLCQLGFGVALLIGHRKGPEQDQYLPGAVAPRASVVMKHRALYGDTTSLGSPRPFREVGATRDALGCLAFAKGSS